MNEQVYKLPRLYVGGVFLGGEEVALGAEQSHYLVNVMRLSEGAPVRIFNQCSGEFIAHITKPHKKAALIKIGERLREPASSMKYRALIFSPLKKDRMDFLIEKAVELGVSELRPAIFDHSAVRKINEVRLQAQIIEAAEQCERLDIPVLHPLKPLANHLQDLKNASVYVCVARQESALLKDISLDESPCFVVGPEGGVSANELEMMEKKDLCSFVSLGERVLRAETAVLACLAVAG